MEVDHRYQVNDHYWTARVQGKALRCNLLTYEMMNFATSKYCVKVPVFGVILVRIFPHSD